ncbi:[FeFe] hydrogenase H-cluster radical SAM maturase HydG [Ructibacterium gallinarum]|uniref:[FeFe] hydrogenase H-cluster radical SAM maturase HydG n=1 Tax=Ructibacterium gallinarum TaxID=2779355 RepID=A0A9D5LZX0_9FIRM|nr:[FeFe] hydrogenase H-cluster radical SAM maturase HydG [Ructibacterium gallinarum]MBE5039675.1 [FeFe] hydrogenase H-cluster radical SAM maturase HydG [Ructibacterium gallinarum]
MFIDEKYMNELLENAKHTDEAEITRILDKADHFEGLTHQEVAALLMMDNPKQLQRMFEIAYKIKQHIYGNRIVMFAPLYVSDYCVNQCKYCSYNCKHQFNRRRLTMDEIREEVKILEAMGHKRLAVEAGEDDAKCPIDYILECMKTIYDMKFENGEIRRVNVNIAATTVENYKKLKEVGIGTYILFQETYHKPTYLEMHISGPKRNYEYHTTAFDRAMQGGIDDVGGGVLFGLYDPYFEVLGLMLHNEHLEKEFGVGFHTISVPRIRKAEGALQTEFQYAVDDETFKKLVAVIRLAVPFTGMIISTRESEEMRKELIRLGISQMSAGSATGVGSYKSHKDSSVQFKVIDERDAMDVIKWIMDEGMVPSFCTACYRSGRTGDRFMSLAKSGNIKNVCLPNALMTLAEYAIDYGDDEFKEKAHAIIQKEIPNIGNENVRELVKNNIEKIKQGQRDLFI